MTKKTDEANFTYIII